jgi:hypothetical protein
MTSNELREHIRRLNKKEAVEIELRRQKAINRINQLRQELKEKQRARDDVSQ